MKGALALVLLWAVGCEEAPRYGSVPVARAPHPVWQPRSARRLAPDETFRAQMPRASPATGTELPVVAETTLANGVRVLTVERHGLPVASLRIVVSWGALQAPPGVAALAVEMLFAGTSRREGVALRQMLSEMGAQVEWSTSYDDVSITAHVPATNASDTLNALTEAVRFSIFPADEIAEARSDLIARIDHQSSSPESAAATQLDAMLYPAPHPYHAPVDGDPQALRRIGRNELASFWRTASTPSLTTILVAGDVDRTALVTQIHGLLDDWSGATGEPRILPAIGSSPNPRVVLLDHAGDPQAVVRVGWLVPDRRSPDIAAFRTLAAVVSERLYRNLRIERGKTYGVQSFVWPRVGASEFVFTTAVDRDGLADALRELFSEIDDVRRQSLDEREMPAARALATTFVWRSLETSGAVVDALTPVATYKEPLNLFFSRLRTPNAPPENVQAVAKRYLDVEGRAVVAVGDAKYLRPAFEQVGLTDVVVRPLVVANSR